MIALTLFWAATGLLVYIYLGYAFTIRLASRVAGRPVSKAPLAPNATVVVAAYNEERGIRVKLDNILALEYPTGRLEVIVASDASTDGTDAIVQSYGDSRVRLLRIEGRVGKTACQNAAVEAAHGEIVVFTDATTVIEHAALVSLMPNFADPAVGCVAAQLTYVARGDNLTASGGTAYWSYEVALRIAESALGSLIGVSGCLYAVRRSAYRPIRPDLISDFVIAMQMRAQGLRTVLEPGAICFEETLNRSGEELSMRVRVAIRSIAALISERRFLNPFRHGLFAIELLSHKLLRYASPFVWAVALAACIPLADRMFYMACLLGQVALLAAGIAGFVLHRSGARLGVLAQPYYFVLTNIASLVAVARYLRGDRVRIWNPVRT